MEVTAILVALIAGVATVGAAWVGTRSRTGRELTEPEAIILALQEAYQQTVAERDDCRKRLDAERDRGLRL